MSTLQEKVNQAFRDANPSTPSTTLTKDQWLQQEWPELQKPQLIHLSQVKIDPKTVQPPSLRRRNAYNQQTDNKGNPFDDKSD